MRSAHRSQTRRSGRNRRADIRRFRPHARVRRSAGRQRHGLKINLAASAASFIGRPISRRRFSALSALVVIASVVMPAAGVAADRICPGRQGAQRIGVDHNVDHLLHPRPRQWEGKFPTAAGAGPTCPFRRCCWVCRGCVCWQWRQTIEPVDKYHVGCLEALTPRAHGDTNVRSASVAQIDAVPACDRVLPLLGRYGVYLNQGSRSESTASRSSAAIVSAASA